MFNPYFSVQNVQLYLCRIIRASGTMCYRLCQYQSCWRCGGSQIWLLSSYRSIQNQNLFFDDVEDVDDADNVDDFEDDDGVEGVDGVDDVDDVDDVDYVDYVDGVDVVGLVPFRFVLL